MEFVVQVKTTRDGKAPVELKLYIASVRTTGEAGCFGDLLGIMLPSYVGTIEGSLINQPVEWKVRGFFSVGSFGNTTSRQVV